MNIFDLYEQLSNTFEKKQEELDDLNKKIFELECSMHASQGFINQHQEYLKKYEREQTGLKSKAEQAKRELKYAEEGLKKIDIWEIVKGYSAAASSKEAKEHWDNLIKTGENKKL